MSEKAVLRLPEKGHVFKSILQCCTLAGTRHCLSMCYFIQDCKIHHSIQGIQVYYVIICKQTEF